MGERCQGGEREKEITGRSRSQDENIHCCSLVPPPRSPPKPLHTSLPVIQGVFSSIAKKVRSQSRRMSGKKRGGDMYDVTSSLANKKKQRESGPP